MNDYPQVVKDIHDEFNLAGERLLQESLAIIKESETFNLNKGELLSSIGFNSTKEATALKPKIAVKNEAQELANIVLSYKSQFPLNKFISFSDVDKINKKYSLKLNYIDSYIGFVPDKNLKEVNNFLKNPSAENKRYFIESINIFKMAMLFSFAKMKFKRWLKNINHSIIAANEWSAKSAVDNQCGKISSSTYNSEYISIHGINLIEKPVLSICAPAKDFKKQTVFQKLASPVATKINDVPDPIVLYPVEKGYIIVTAWGDEASDPLVANEQMN